MVTLAANPSRLSRSARRLLFLVGVCTPLIGFGADAVRVTIETEILEPDPQPGVKSRHLVDVDFDNRLIVDAYQTGTTEFFGIELDSVRDRFRVTEIAFDGQRRVSFEVSGQTASGVRALPNLNYRFRFELDRDGEHRFSGCHDAYPAYRVIIDGSEQYAYRHRPINLIPLFGQCDVSVVR